MTAKCALKAEAKRLGQTRYISSTPCSKGHGFERLVINGNCVECSRQTRRESYRRIPAQRDAAREAARIKRTSDPLGARQSEVRTKLKTHYGLTEQQYAAMFTSQRGRCAICTESIVSRLDESRPQYKGRGAPSNSVARVDHCHSTNAIRGLLCSNCNIGIGKFRDEPKILLNAVRYLRESVTAQAQPVAERESVSEIEPGNRDLESSVRRGSRRNELSPFFD